MADLNRLALELCLQVGSRAAEIRRRDGLGTALWGLWRIDEALAEYREALRLSESLGIVQVSPLLCNMGGILMEVGDYAGAVEWQERALQNAIEAQLALIAPTAATNLAEAYWHSGRLDAFREALQRAAPHVERAPESRFQAHFLQNRGRLLRSERAFEQSAQLLEHAVDLYERTGRWSDAAEALDDLALTHLESGEISPATDALARRAAVVTGHAYRSIRHDWTEARVHRAGGRLEESRRALQRAHDFFAEQLAALGDKTLRASFEAIPVHVALRTAFERDQWPVGDGLETPTT